MLLSAAAVQAAPQAAPDAQATPQQQKVNAQDTQAAALLNQLADGSYHNKAKTIEQIADSSDERARQWLEAFAANKLARLEDSGEFVIIIKNRGRHWTIANALTGEPMGKRSRRDIDVIRVNNQLRNQLQDILSVIDLKVSDPERRLAAARDLRGKVTAEMTSQLRKVYVDEDHAEVKSALEEALAIYQLDTQQDPEAIEILDGSLSSEARAALNRAAQSDQPELAAAAKKALSGIQDKLKLNRAAETLYFGLSLGSVLVLAAIGLAITFGVMGVINMAHGELMMLGAYTTWGMQQLLPDSPGLALVLSIPAGFLVAALVGIGIERSVIRHLQGRPLETLLATFGISLILQQLVRTVISPLNRTVITPEWMSGSIMINEALSLTLNRLYIMGFAALVFIGLMMIMRKTRLGLEVRAVTQNRAMARAMGIRATRVDIMTFGLGSGVAGLAGVALSQITNVGPNLGQNYIIDSFMVVVFGGVGNLWGTLVAGLSLGTLNQLLEPWAGAVLAKIVVLVFIILFIQKRPRGLFPQKGRAAEG
ncbi:urea ABC transporter permease subunit UrtB [Terasakiispira papahanaumokuakeensis]|uniref:Urea ABC transporter permease subunit UrtB n=1 Tax=Terasakiispira papahanaumokuakeensis TaxID=197479 RepID=A0A1E2V710_9GAMM|nr:urea ABC transporter permease subunit UrtB [Terasakiispira papahanaumokuakeensis]ODC02789.1 urea ABC transporter permease subunit UrtB [Terasakiispira papahanaumokuakeensis]